MGEDRVEFDRFRQLFQNGTPDEFFPFARDYEKHLRDKGYMMLYYKLLNNEGFYAQRHNMIFRAMEIAKRLDSELRNDGASQFYYLASGLLGDVYSASHDRIKAEQYFTQALNEVGDNDPKFTMRTYHSMAEMFCLKDSRKSLEWLQQAQRIATETGNTEYLSLSLAMTAYVHFIEGNSTLPSRNISSCAVRIFQASTIVMIRFSKWQSWLSTVIFRKPERCWAISAPLMSTAHLYPSVFTRCRTISKAVSRPSGASNWRTTPFIA